MSLTLSVTGVRPDNMGDPVETDYTIYFDRAGDGSVVISAASGDGDTDQWARYTGADVQFILWNLQNALKRTKRPRKGTIGLNAEVCWDVNGMDDEVVDVGPHAADIVAWLVRSHYA